MKIKRIKNEKFKTNLMAIFLTMPLEKENITKNALIPAVLRRGSQNYKTQLEIGKKLENMYGASFNCGIDKTGDYCVLKFFMQTLNNEYGYEDDNIIQEASDLLFDIIFNPLIENQAFFKEYVEQEKSKLREIIESRKDNKNQYAISRCVEEIFKGEPYEAYRFGYVEDLENINEKNLYEHYKNIITNCKINLIIEGLDADTVDFSKFEDKKINDIQIVKTEHEIKKSPKIVKEQMDVTQGKLVIGLNVKTNNKFAASMYNVILGGGANSKLFQNVREKEGLAYSAGSRYIRRKDLILIIAGIELQNYDKTLKIIKEQLEDIKNGKISDDEIEAARQLILSSTDMIYESQEDMIAYELDQELFDENLSLEEYKKNIEAVKKEEIIEIANNVFLDTIYYLEK